MKVRRVEERGRVEGEREGKEGGGRRVEGG